jgi:glycosyltransferase involved in cell wall biosynthesis
MPPSSHSEKKMLRLTFLSARNGIHTVKWVNGMAARGHETHLVTMHRGGDPLDDKVHVHFLPSPAPWGYFSNAFAARRLLSQIEPDILHTHYATGYGTLGRLTGFHPQILSVWGMDVYDFPDHSPMHRWLLLRNLRGADWICSTSEVMAQRTRSLWPAIKRLSVTPFGIDTDQFHPMADVRDPNAITIGTVKTLDPKYGVDLLIRAFAAARHRLETSLPHVASKLRLWIVGGGSDRARLEALASGLGLDGVTTFVGSVPHQQVVTHLNSLDIYVAASRSHSESFGVAVLEASACGLPVVVSDAGGLPEVVKHKETGLVVPREDVTALADALLFLIDDIGLRQRLGSAGREHVTREYQWSNSLLLMEQIYSQILEA